MPFYKVQYAYAPEVGTPAIHRNEKMASDEVAHLLKWLMDNLESYASALEFRGEEPEFIADARAVAPQIRYRIAQGNVWPAYNLWQEFYDRHESRFGRPLFVVIGTVLVDTADPKVKAKRPLLPTSDVPPHVQYPGPKGTTVMALREQHLELAMLESLMQEAAQEAEKVGLKITHGQFSTALDAVAKEVAEQIEGNEPSQREFFALIREGVLRRLFGTSLGASLGAFQSWLVQYRDFGGIWHPSRHTNEERAKIQASDYLNMLMKHLLTSSLFHSNDEFVKQANDLAGQVRELLAQEKVWTAYHRYMEFMEQWDEETGPMPLSMAIGAMRVVPEPSPE